MTPFEVVTAYFEAMKAGPGQVDRLLDLFADDAVYVEPFSGETRTHSGHAAISDCIRTSMKDPPPDMTLEVNRVDVDGDTVRSEWTCASPVFPGPMKGVDLCTVRKGRIQRLEVQFV